MEHVKANGDRRDQPGLPAMAVHGENTGLTAALADAHPARLVRVGLILVDHTGVVRRMDAAAAHLLEMDALDDVEQKRMEDLLPPVDADELAASRAPAPTTWLARGPGAAGGRLLVNLTEMPLLPGHHVAAVTSVNEYLAETQSRARIQLRATVDAVIAGFAHEVRNPLAAILSITEAALQEDEENHDSPLVRVPGLVARVEKLIRQSLAYSRPSTPNRVRQHPVNIIERACQLLRPRTGPVARVQVVNGQEVFPAVMVDMQHAEQIVVNMVENALDVAIREVQVLVHVQQQGTVLVDVRDDGPGVPQDLAARIFNPFFTTKASGTGLGLSIARDLARLNGGDLALLETTTRGATFRLVLPSTDPGVRGDW